MEKSNKTKVILNLLFGNYKLIVPAIVMIAIIIGIVAWLNRDNSIEIGNSNDDIEISDAQITSIRNIGEWEFMSINDEEIVDTVRRGFFGDDQLARIYYGTVRLGVNLHEAAEDWLTIDKDTVIAKMPKIKVLDEDFIDEARTRAFYAEGKWSAADYKALYKQAYRKMRERCLTPSNIKSAQNNGDIQIANLLHSMGDDNITHATVQRLLCFCQQFPLGMAYDDTAFRNTHLYDDTPALSTTQIVYCHTLKYQARQGCLGRCVAIWRFGYSPRSYYRYW